MSTQNSSPLGFFERYLTLWVAICIVAGVALGQFIPLIPETLSRWEYAQVSIPVAVLIWMMIYPMMLKIEFASVVNALKMPKGLIVTCSSNWLIKPFSMFFFAWLFLRVIFGGLIPDDLATEYIAGAVLLGAAPCTAMVFVWSHLTKGSPAYTVVQVSINNLILLVAFTPIVMFLLGISEVLVPYDTLLLSVLLFILVPLSAGYASRKIVIQKRVKTILRTSF
jgi:ACR3 family arsenite transporter